MADLQLSLIMGSNDRSRPVLDGAVKPDGIDLTCTTAHPSEIFCRQLHFQEFDVSEMSLSSLLMAMAHGNRDWVALPIFTSRLPWRSEEHTSELQSHLNLVCRLLLEKKK